jgi:hypothetical protein
MIDAGRRRVNHPRSMATWGEVQAHARRKYKLENDGEEGFSAIVAFDNDRTQLVGVHHFSALERGFLELRSYVCKETEMAAKVALQKNTGFVFGGLALDEEGDVCFLYSVPIAGLDLATLDLLVANLARMADKLEAAYAGSDHH